MDSVYNSTDITFIKINDDYYKTLYDTTFNNLKIEVLQNGKEVAIYYKCFGSGIVGDTIAKNYYYLQLQLFHNKKQIKTYYANMLDNYGYYSANNYLHHNLIEWECAINKFNHNKEIVLPVWHISNDSTGITDITFKFNLFTIDSSSYNKADDINKLTKKIKPLLTINKQLEIKNYNFIVKKFIIDSIYIHDYAYDFGLFGDADLFYVLHTPYNKLTSSTDDQFHNGITSIDNVYLFLQKHTDNIILKLYDEDVLYDDYVDALKIWPTNKDSSYAFIPDTNIISRNLIRLYYTVKNHKR